MAISVDAEVQAGQAHQREGRSNEAAQAYGRALQIQPQHVAALAGMASALTALHRLDEAEAHGRRAIALDPRHPAAVRALTGLLQLRERHAEALALATTVTAQDPRHAEAWLAAGDSLANMGRHAEALDSYRSAYATGEVNFEALARIGAMLDALGQPGALEAFDAALALQPETAAVQLQRGTLRLSHRDFARGWEDYEARWRSPRFIASSRGLIPPPMIPALATRARLSDLEGKRIVVVGEQALGDQVMFASVIPDLVRVAKSVMLVCEPRLVRLFQASFDGVDVVDPRQAKVDTDEIDAILAIGGLPFAFRRSEADFPGAPYLRPRPELRQRWAERLGPRPAALRIGLSWRGGVAATRQGARSVTLDQLAPILDLPGCEFVSLQYGDTAADLAGRPIRAFPAQEIDDVEDLAALTAELDVVVSVTTTLVHLCGAIGQECLTLVPPSPVWRYGATGVAIPWYNSVRLYRQPAPDAWAPVVEEVAAVLRSRLAASAP